MSKSEAGQGNIPKPRSGDLVIKAVEVIPGVYAVGAYEVPSQEEIEALVNKYRAEGASEVELDAFRQVIRDFFGLSQ